MGYKKYTDLEKALICELCKVTNNVRYTSRVSGASCITINNFIEEKGIELSREPSDIVCDRDIINEQLYRRAESGESLEEIAESLGVTKNNVTRRISRYKNKFNLDKINHNKNRSKKLDIVAEEWYKLIKNGTKTMTQIAKENEISLSGVSRRISRYLKRQKTKTPLKQVQ